MKDKVIIIPVHNQLLLVQKCIRSVYKQPNAIIIVVDDGSDVETSNWLRTHPSIRLIRNETAQGFSKACNKAIDYAMSNFDFTCLCLLNSDAEIVTDNWFDKVENHFLIGDNIGIAGVVSNNALNQTIHDIPRYLKDIDNKPTLYCHLIHGFCYFISRELIERIGRLDDITFPHYGSEDDYSLKSIGMGYHNIIVGSVLVKHVAEQSYTPKVRTEFVKHTVPTLTKRWGRVYVDSCVKQAINVGKHLNNYG